MLLHHLCHSKWARQRFLWPRFASVRCQGSDSAAVVPFQRRLYGCVCIPMKDPAGSQPHILMRLGPTVTFLHTITISFKNSSSCKTVCSTSYMTHTTHTSMHAHTYLIIYHLHAHIHLLWRCLTRLVIAATLFYIHMREPQRSPFLSLFLSYEYKLVKAESKEILEISSVLLLSSLSPCSIFFWHFIEPFYRVKRWPSVKESPQL